MTTPSAWVINGFVQMHGANVDLTPAEAREFAARLLAAADDADALRRGEFRDFLRHIRITKVMPVGARHPEPRDG